MKTAKELADEIIGYMAPLTELHGRIVGILLRNGIGVPEKSPARIAAEKAMPEVESFALPDGSQAGLVGKGHTNKEYHIARIEWLSAHLESFAAEAIKNERRMIYDKLTRGFIWSNAKGARETIEGIFPEFKLNL